MRIVLTTLCAALVAGPVAAGETAWQELADDVRFRVVAAEVLSPDGTTLLGLEIEMPADTKTYWRIPGESGIPAELDISGSRGIAALELQWPYPTLDVSAGYTDYVYYGPTVLPMIARVDGDTAELVARITLGVCAEVCMPAMANIVMPLDFARPDVANKIRLDQAMALVPIPWSGAPDAIGQVSVTPSGDAIEVALADPAIAPGSLIADVGPSEVLFGAPQIGPDGPPVLLPLLAGDPDTLAGRSVTLTFMTPAGAYETTRPIGPAALP